MNMEGTRVVVDGREGTICEVFNGDSISIEFDDRPGVVMVVELCDPALIFVD